MKILKCNGHAFFLLIIRFGFTDLNKDCVLTLKGRGYFTNEKDGGGDLLAPRLSRHV